MEAGGGGWGGGVDTEGSRRRCVDLRCEHWRLEVQVTQHRVLPVDAPVKVQRVGGIFLLGLVRVVLYVLHHQVPLLLPTPIGISRFRTPP